MVDTLFVLGYNAGAPSNLECTGFLCAFFRLAAIACVADVRTVDGRGLMPSDRLGEEVWHTVVPGGRHAKQDGCQ